jgi:cytochrome c5
MRENVEAHQHESPIKTPQQLIVVVVLAFLVPIVGILLLASFITGTRSVDPNSPAMSPEAVAARLKPVGEVALVDPNAPKVVKTGEEVVKAVCSACHATGAAGAPKIGDKAAWGPRIKEGLPELIKTAIKGENAMPPRGGSPDLSDLEITRAIVFMTNQSGASFKEPAAPAAAPPPAKAGETPAANAAAAAAPATQAPATPPAAAAADTKKK